MEFSVKKFSEKEEKSFGIFISHSNNTQDLENYLYPLSNKMEEVGLQPIYDRMFLAQGDDFKKKIFKYIASYAAVIIISHNSLKSSWVNFELGRFTGQDIPIFIFDPENLLDSNTSNEYTSVSFLKRFAPFYHTIDELVDSLKDLNLYSDIFSYETSLCSKEKFWNACEGKLDKVMLLVKTDILEKDKHLFERVKVGVNFSGFGQSDCDINKMCAPKYFKGEPQCIDGICEYCGHQCSLKKLDHVDDSNIECIYLGKLLYTGKIFFMNDINPFSDEDPVFHQSCIMVHFPLHKYYGTKFKLFMDAPTDAEAEQIVDAFRGSEFIVNVSSRGGKRVYIGLPDDNENSLYLIDSMFHDNFLCSFAAKNE